MAEMGLQNKAPHARLIALTILFLSGSGALAQLLPPTIHIVPNPNPSNSLVLPAPGQITVSPDHRIGSTS
jgi:hypothetical protein